MALAPARVEWFFCMLGEKKKGKRRRKKKRRRTEDRHSACAVRVAMKKKPLHGNKNFHLGPKKPHRL